MYGIRFRNIKVVEKVFNVCCMLHNFMLSEMTTRDTNARVGRGGPIGQDAIWLAGPLTGSSGGTCTSTERQLAAEWGRRRRALVAHLTYSKQQQKRARRSL